MLVLLFVIQWVLSIIILGNRVHDVEGGWVKKKEENRSNNNTKQKKQKNSLRLN